MDIQSWLQATVSVQILEKKSRFISVAENSIHIGNFAAPLNIPGKKMSSEKFIPNNPDDMEVGSACQPIKRGGSGGIVGCCLAAIGAQFWTR